MPADNSIATPLDGVLVFNKPTGITSAKALYQVRKLTGQRKSGHAGTLDPAADGVLLLLLGKATKLTESLMDLPKTYVAEARLDVTSRSHDSDDPLEPIAVESIPTPDAVDAAFAVWEGDVLQLPPQVSALKVGGKPAYKLAKRDKPVPLEPRPVSIYWITVLDYAWPDVRFAMACGRGTYVRAVIRDVGAALGTGGCLTRLTRTAIGPFQLENACSADDLADRAAAPRLVIPVARSLQLVSEYVGPPNRP